MINLIPKNEEKKVIQDFYLRILIVFIFIITISFLISSISLFPAYLISIEKENLISKKINELNSKLIPELNEEAQKIINDVEKKVEIINLSRNNYLISERIIEKIIDKKNNNIKINRINYEKLPENNKIIITGTASDRESLLSFRRSFENDKNFKSVDLPISNFIKGSDIVFYLSLTSL